MNESINDQPQAHISFGDAYRIARIGSGALDAPEMPAQRVLYGHLPQPLTPPLVEAFTDLVGMARGSSTGQIVISDQELPPRPQASPEVTKTQVNSLHWLGQMSLGRAILKDPENVHTQTFRNVRDQLKTMPGFRPYMARLALWRESWRLF